MVRFMEVISPEIKLDRCLITAVFKPKHSYIFEQIYLIICSKYQKLSRKWFWRDISFAQPERLENLKLMS